MPTSGQQTPRPSSLDDGSLDPPAATSTIEPLLIDECMNSGAVSTLLFQRPKPFAQGLLFWFRASWAVKKLLLIEFLRRTWRDVVEDLKGVRWSRGGLWLLFFCWVALLLTADAIVPTLPNWTTLSVATRNSACQADGSFDVIANSDAWKIDDFFQITAGFGPLTFTQAKVIDVIWDVVSCSLLASAPAEESYESSAY